MALLKNELSVVYFDSQFHGQNIQQCVKLLKEFQDSGLLMEVYKLFCLIMTIPSTIVSVERNFSCLKRIKTYLRNSMTEERLSSLATISMNYDLNSDVDTHKLEISVSPIKKHVVGRSGTTNFRFCLYMSTN